MYKCVNAYNIHYYTNKFFKWFTNQSFFISGHVHLILRPKVEWYVYLVTNEFD